MKTLSLIAAAMLASSAAVADGFPVTNCKAHDFEFKQFDVIRESDSTWVKVIGEVVNHCGTPASISFRIVYRDANGRIVHVGEFVAGPSGENIQPDESAAFDANDHIDAPWSKIDGPKISNIVQWPD